jgi:hypothetical protein
MKVPTLAGSAIERGLFSRKGPTRPEARGSLGSSAARGAGPDAKFANRLPVPSSAHTDFASSLSFATSGAQGQATSVSPLVPQCSLRICLRARHTSGEKTFAHASRLSCRNRPAAVSPATLRKARARGPRDPSPRRARAARARPAGRAADGVVGGHRRGSRACDRRAGCPVRRRSRRASHR